MFKWFLRLFSKRSSVEPINIYVHVDGQLRIIHEGGSGYKAGIVQGPDSITPATENHKGDIGKNTGFEAGIDPEFFADTGATEANFGTEVELPPKTNTDEDH